MFAETPLNVCEMPLYMLLFAFFHFAKVFPSPQVWIDSCFCCCGVSTGLARCLQDFANVPSVANVFAMFAKMFAWF